MAGGVKGAELPDDFTPALDAGGKPADAANLRGAMRDKGFQILGTELGDWPASDEAKGWLEAGNIDHRGHDLGDELARQIEPELDRLAEQAAKLLSAGWSQVLPPCPSRNIGQCSSRTSFP